jgi:uncharacterized membrane protein YeaQ/YmgE (transglycosylase-associated protein family)
VWFVFCLGTLPKEDQALKSYKRFELAPLWIAKQKERKMIAILGWIIFGLIAGLIAKAIMPGRDPGGFIITILLGIAGAIIGGFIGQALFGYGRAVNDSGDINQPGFLMSLVLAVVGAIVLLGLYRLVKGRRPEV